jgi:hypothetical protein
VNRELREKPPAGLYEWPNNGEIHERLRVGLLEEAAKAEAAGDLDRCEELRQRASAQRRERNRCYQEYERRRINRALRYGRF